MSVAQPIGERPGATADAAAEAPDDPFARDLVAYWKLDEQGAGDEVLDSSGRGHSGTVVNGALSSTSVPPVRFNDRASRSFDGVSQYILVRNNDDMNFSGKVTLAAWVNVASLSAGCHYIVGHGYCFTPPGEVVLRIGAPGCDPGETDRYWTVGSWLAAPYLAFAPFNDLDLNVWIHIVGVYDGQTWRLYRNGEEIGRQDNPVGAVPVTTDWSIGARAPAVAPCIPVPSERFFDGLIDDVRIYRRALGPSEIEELYHR